MSDSSWTDIAVAIGSLVAAGVLLVGLGLAAAQLRSANKTRNIEAITDRSRRWDEESLVEARLGIGKASDPRAKWEELLNLGLGESTEFFLFMRIPHFFEDLGTATLQAEALDRKLVFELFAPSIEHYWGWYEPFVDAYRKHMADARIFEWFERLAREATKAKK